MRVSLRFAVIIMLIAMGMTTLSLSTTGPVSAQAAVKRYVLVGAGNSLPAGFESLIASVGGQVVYQLDEIGVAVAESADPSFADAAAGIAGLQGVAEDRAIPLSLPDQGDSTIVESLDAEAALEGAAAEGINPALAKFFPVQWNMKAIRAPEAWNAGFTGDQRVKVAVIDTGIDYNHQEFQRLVNGKMVSIVDPVLSKSFFNEFDWPPSASDFGKPVPGQPGRTYTPLPPGLPGGFVPKDYMDFYGHGTHVAGIIASKGVSVAGIAPNVTLIAVKVADRRGFATWATIITAVKYAADVGANVINMSFGDDLEKGGRENAQLMAALNRAVNYAHDKGVLLVASAGNRCVASSCPKLRSAIDWDRRICETTDAGKISILNCPQGKIPSTMTMVNMMKIPAQLPHVAAVSASGPQFGINVDVMGVDPGVGGTLGVYTDHGMSIITFAAPGGSVTPFILPNGMPADAILSACSRFTEFLPHNPTRWPCKGSRPGLPNGVANVFMVGTSMAAAHVSGVAALVDSAAGGTLTGDQIMEILMQSAEDLGKPGKDEWYGFGRIDAYRAVTGK